MEIEIENIDLLLPKKVPKHGKVSGIKKERGAVRVIIPKKGTKLSLTVSEPSELLVRNVTPDGKILGLTNFIGQKIYIIGQGEEELEKETGTFPLFDDEEYSEKREKVLKRLFEECEKDNLDPSDLLEKLIDLSEKSEKVSKKRGENE